jgi:hypothetical protein
MHGFENVTTWKVVGRYLQKHHPGARVATVPIGAIGYYFHGHVLDLVGLTAAPIAKSGTSTYPKPLERHWIGHERHLTPWVLEQKPDLIVTTEVRAEPWTDLQEARAGFIADWELVRLAKRGAIPYDMLDAEIAPGAHWLMFQRRAKALPTPVP